MNREGLSRALSLISAETGLPLTAESDFESEAQPIEIRVAGLNPLESFHIKTHRTAIAWVIDFSFDTFSGQLAEIVSEKIRNYPSLIADFVDEFRAFSSVDSNIDDIKKSELATTDGFKIRLIGHDTLNQKDETVEQEIAIYSELVVNVLNLINFILTLNDEVESDDYESQIEGDRNQSACGKYERSVRNRMLCLDFWGFSCQTCGLDPEQTYGLAGKKIIHVHHKTPLSQMEKPGPVDPKSDLIPLCPNCHNFAHKRVPPFSPEEIKEILSARAAQD